MEGRIIEVLLYPHTHTLDYYTVLGTLLAIKTAIGPF